MEEQDKLLRRIGKAEMTRLGQFATATTRQLKFSLLPDSEPFFQGNGRGCCSMKQQFRFRGG